MICDDLEAWDGRGNGSETQEKGDVRILMAGSCCCTAETNTEKAMAPHSSTLAWKIPWTEEPGGLQSMGSLRVGHD